MTEFKFYKQILPELIDKSRVEQYKLLLQTFEWKSFREKVIRRDLNKCSKCGKENDNYPQFEVPYEEWKEMCEQAVRENKMQVYIEIIDGNFEIKQRQYIPPKIIIEDLIRLEVHHKFYFFNKLPWEYKLEDLTSLCHSCHQYIHQTEIIYTYFDNTLTRRKAIIPCTKCNGTGYLPEYDHYKNGVCFECGGTGGLINEIEEWEYSK